MRIYQISITLKYKKKCDFCNVEKIIKLKSCDKENYYIFISLDVL